MLSASVAAARYLDFECVNHEAVTGAGVWVLGPYGMYIASVDEFINGNV